MPSRGNGTLVLGLDVALRFTGVAAIQDGRVVWRATIKVEGDSDKTGPRFALLREALEKMFLRQRVHAPAFVAIEQPDLNLRKGRKPGDIMKLYGAFAVCYAECQRLWPSTKVKGVTPRQWKGNLQKDLTMRMMTAKYGVESFANDHEADALGIADYAWDLLVERDRKV